MYIRQYPLPRDERVVIRFENEKGGGALPSYFKWAKRRRAGWTQAIIDVTLGEKREPRIQVADLLAHQAWTRVTDVMRHGDDWPMRRPFARMSSDETIKLDYSREDQCIGSMPLIREFFQAYPEGIIAPPHPGRRP